MNSGWSGSDHFISAQILDAEGNVILFDNQRNITDLKLAPGEYKIILIYDLDKMIEAGDYIFPTECAIHMADESDKPTTPSDETTVSHEPTTPDDNPQSVIPPTSDKKPQTDQSETKKTTKKANIKAPSKTKVVKVTVAKKIVFKGAGKVSKKVKKLKSKKNYYVRVRAYKIIKGKKVYATWSKAKKVKTK